MARILGGMYEALSIDLHRLPELLHRRDVGVNVTRREGDVAVVSVK